MSEDPSQASIFRKRTPGPGTTPPRVCATPCMGVHYALLRAFGGAWELEKGCQLLESPRDATNTDHVCQIMSCFSCRSSFGGIACGGCQR